MAKIYSRVTKINNVAGRSDYISNPDRQEHLRLTEKSLSKKRKTTRTEKKQRNEPLNAQKCVLSDF